LDAAAQQALLDELARRLAELRAALIAGAYAVAGQVPPDGDAIGALATWLASAGAPHVAASPRVG
jgi:hypothetical protein